MITIMSKHVRKMEECVSAPEMVSHFWQNVFIPDNAANDCWIWMASTDSSGYGRTRLGTYREGWPACSAHIISYVLNFGTIPHGLQVDHLCKIILCVSPFHLEAVTPKVNSMRSDSIAAIAGRSTHCKRGHEFSLENTYTYGGHRACRTCWLAGERRRYHAQKNS